MEAVTMEAVTMEAVTMEVVTMEVVTMEAIAMGVVAMEVVARYYKNIIGIHLPSTVRPFHLSLAQLLASLSLLGVGRVWEGNLLVVTLVCTTLHPKATSDLMLCSNALILYRVVSWCSCQGGMTSWPS